MRKLFWVGLTLVIIIGMGSCSYDDSNDIDIIMPKDSTTTGNSIDHAGH